MGNEDYQGRVARLAAPIGGREIRYDTRDGTLHPSVEALASLYLLPCLRLGCPASIPGRADRRWRKNARQLSRIFGNWMGWQTDLPLRFRGGFSPQRPTQMPRGTAAFYTGGLDSMHTLLFPSKAIDALIYVIGYDTSKRDFERLKWIENTVRSHARRRNLEAIILRSNLRGWELFEQTDWHLTHGAALAAVGHLLSHRFHSILIPSSSPEWETKRIGSNAATDPLWSSSHVSFIYDGGQYDRIAKVARVANHPECSEALRVCGRDIQGKLNCGRCEKCIRTILCFLASGQPLPDILNPPEHLPRLLSQLTPLPAGLLPLYHKLHDKLDPFPDIRSALSEALRISRENQAAGNDHARPSAPKN